MTTQPNEPELLATFDKCPNCGSTEFFMQGLVDKTMEKENYKTRPIPCLQPMSSAIISNDDLMLLMVPKVVDVGMVVVDACTKCGTLVTTQQLLGKQLATPGAGMGIKLPGM